MDLKCFVHRMQSLVSEAHTLEAQQKYRTKHLFIKCEHMVKHWYKGSRALLSSGAGWKRAGDRAVAVAVL